MHTKTCTIEQGTPSVVVIGVSTALLGVTSVFALWHVLEPVVSLISNVLS